jgi:protein TonB
MTRPQNRALFHAVLLSLAVHALLLFGRMPSVRRAPDAAAPPPLVATIAEPQPEPPKAEPQKPPPKPRERSPEAGKAAPVALAKEEAPAAPRAEEPAPAPAPQPQAAAAASASAQARAAATEAAVARTIAQYRRQVIGAAAAFNRYPRLARENNWEGAVEVEMSVRGDGALGALGVKTGSGHDVLDEQALEMFRQAQARVPLPPALRGRDFTLEMKAIYRLKDADAQ